MYNVEAFLTRLASYTTSPCFFQNEKMVTYEEFIKEVNKYESYFRSEGLAGAVVYLFADSGPQSYAAFFALSKLGSVIVPMMNDNQVGIEKYYEITGAKFSVFVNDAATIVKIIGYPTSDRLLAMRVDCEPIAIYFSSGSTGQPKAIVHNFNFVLDRFRSGGKSCPSILFLMFDHFGGLNTVLGILSSGGAAIICKDRSIQTICEKIEKHKVSLLPTTPSFLNLLILSDAHIKYDLSSLNRITYGTEVMSESTLAKCKSIFPNVTFQQTYGLTETGVLSTKSENDGSLWVKLGGAGYETKVVDGILKIKSKYTMLGYLNSEPAVDEDGWFDTQDMVETKGEYIKILGRKSEIINVGGQKVYPSEVENLLLGLDNVIDVAVFGEKNPLLGEIVAAKFQLSASETIESLRLRVTSYAASRLAKFKIPMKFYVTTDKLSGIREKKIRRA